VLDFHEAMTTLTRQVLVHDTWLHSVRIAQFQRTPPITRIVLDVSDTRQMPELSFSVNSLFVRPKASTASIVHPPTSGSVAKPARPAAPTVTPSTHGMASAAVGLATAAAAHPAKSFQVTYGKGKLTVVAENSLLSDLISEIASQTGIHFEVARGIAVRVPAVSDPLNDRIQARIGPGEPHEVIQTLLRPSAFRYNLVRSPKGDETVVLVPKEDWIEP